MKKLIILLITTICLGFTVNAQNAHEDVYKLKVNPYITANAGIELGKISFEELQLTNLSTVGNTNWNVGAGVILDDAIKVGLSYRQSFYCIPDIIETVTSRIVTLDMGFIIMPERVYSINVMFNTGYEFGGGYIISGDITQRIRMYKKLYLNVTTGYSRIVSTGLFDGSEPNMPLNYQTSHFVMTTGLTFKF